MSTNGNGSAAAVAAGLQAAAVRSWTMRAAAGAAHPLPAAISVLA